MIQRTTKFTNEHERDGGRTADILSLVKFRGFRGFCVLEIHRSGDGGVFTHHFTLRWANFGENCHCCGELRPRSENFGWKH